MSIKETIRAEIERQMKYYEEKETKAWDSQQDDEDAFWYQGHRKMCSKLLSFIDTLPEQPVSDHHEIEVEFRGEKVTISREFYRNGEMNYSTSEQDDNAIWAALRAWCEKKGITPFELYPKQSEEETADLLAIAHLQGMEQQKGNIKNLLKSWAENELDEHPNKNDDFRLAIYSLMDKLNDL